MGTAFKHSIGKDHLRRLGTSLGRAYPAFDEKAFYAVAKKLEPLELKARVQAVREALRLHLPKDYPKALRILLESVDEGKLKGFDLWPYTDFIQTYGLDHRELSLDALKVLTGLFTAEFAVRPFLRHSPKETLDYLLTCAQSPDVHARRWASEGTRPRLPWGERLNLFIENPRATAAILETLRFDPELYVRKSVANHLNDIAKDHPEYVIEVLKRWQISAVSDDEKKRLVWITRHSLRSLIKNGNQSALMAIGVGENPEIKVLGFRVSAKAFALGERMGLSLEVRSQSEVAQKLVVDYAIHYQKANGKLSPKVFKWKTFELSPGKRVRLEKVHVLKDVTTRVHYEGQHAVAIHINGLPQKTIRWHLTL